MFLQIGFYKLHIYLYILAQTEENQHNTLAQMEESQHNTLYQLEDNQYNTLAQLEENQHNTLDQQEENQHNTLDQLEENQHNTLAQMLNKNQSLADLLEQLMPRPLAKFLDYFLRIISFLINLCFILTILHWTFGIEIGTRIYEIGVLALWTLGISCCAIFAWVVLQLISKAF